MIPSILTLDFDLIFGAFLTFWGPNLLFLGLGLDSNANLGPTHVVEQLSFSMISSILTFDFDLVLGSFFNIGALICYYWGPGLIQTLICGLLM